MPVVIIAALISTSSQLFKGSLFDEIIGATDFSVAITNTGFTQIANTEELISENAVYINASNDDPYLINFITSSDDDVKYQLNIISTDISLDLSDTSNDIGEIISTLNPDTALYGAIGNVNIIKDASNVIEANINPKISSSTDEVETIAWNKKCRYDRNLKQEFELDFSYQATDFTDCNTSLKHYLILEADKSATESRHIIFPIQFTNTQNINWSLPNEFEPNFTEGSSSAVNKNYIEINYTDDSTPAFTFTSTQPYSYSVDLVSSNSPDYSLIRELRFINTQDLIVRNLQTNTEATSNETTFTFDKSCNLASGLEAECSNPSAIKDQAIRITITKDENSKTYYFPLSDGFNDFSPTDEDIELVSPVQNSSFANIGSADTPIYKHDSVIEIDNQQSNNLLPIHLITKPNLQYTYDIELIQSTDDEVVSNINSSTDFEGREISSSTDGQSGLNTINWDGACLDEDEDENLCNDNYLLLTLNNQISTPAKTAYYLFEISYTNTDPDIYWLYKKPFKDSTFVDADSDNTFENDEPLLINLQNSDNQTFYFKSNRANTNYSAKIYYTREISGTEREVTVADLANDQNSGTVNLANLINWNKTCLLEDGSSSTSDRCLELMSEEGLKFKAIFENDLNNDSDFSDTNERLIYESDIQFVRFLEPDWTRPITADNQDFDEFSTSISRFGTEVKAYIYPRPIYVNINPDGDNLTFQLNSLETTFNSTARFVYAENLEAAYNETDEDLLLGKIALAQTVNETNSKTHVWSRDCDDDSDGEVIDCISPEIADMEKAIEFRLLSTETGVDNNNIIYVFPLSFDTPNRPTITIESPEANEEANQDFIPVLIKTGEAAICKASLTEANFNFETEGFRLTANRDKTEHSTETITDLENNTSNTLHVKCAVEEIPTIRNYAKVDFAIGRDGVNIDWISPDFQNSDFTDTSNDAGKPFVAIYDNPLTINSESSGNLAIKFQPVNKEINYETFLATSITEIDYDSILDDPETSTFFDSLENLSDVTGNTGSNFSGVNIDPGVDEATIRWDKQCISSDNTDEACSQEKHYALAIEITDKVTDIPYFYIFPLTISDQPTITSCDISGDELVFNPNTEGLLFTYETNSANISQFDYTITIVNSSGREISEIVDENNVDSGSGTFAWEGQISSSRKVSDDNYSAVFTVEDQGTGESCTHSWNFLVDNREPFTNGEFEILLDDDEFKVPEETIKITLKQNKESYRTVLNVYPKGKTKAIATIYSCVAGEDTDDDDDACPDDIKFEWDGSHFFNYLPEGKYYLKGSILDSSDITIASISEDFTLKHGNIRNTASDNRCTDYFTDIATNDPLCSAVTFVRESEIFLGSNGIIDVNRPLSRAEFITVTNRIKEQENPRVFSRVSDYSPQRDGDMGHSDLRQFVGNSSARWFMEEIWKAKQAGLVKGYSDGTMKPLNLIAGPEAFKLVQLATEVNSSRENKNPWYSDYTEFNYRNGIDTGGITEFTTAVTRGQLIYYIYQLNRAGLYTP